MVFLGTVVHRPDVLFWEDSAYDVAGTHRGRASAPGSCGVAPGSKRFSPMVFQEDYACDVAGTHRGKHQTRKLRSSTELQEVFVGTVRVDYACDVAGTHRGRRRNGKPQSTAFSDVTSYEEDVGLLNNLLIELVRISGLCLPSTRAPPEGREQCFEGIFVLVLLSP